MPDLQFYNSLTRKKEVFVPIDPGHVRLYACGPTVYNYAHIGNARMAVVFDVVARVLRAQYPKVTYVSNITDVDDKIIAASQASGEAIDVLTQKYTQIYNDDMAALGVCEPDVQPKATQHIGDMVDLINTLIAGGHAYHAQGHVLFHVPSFPGYGGLSGRSCDEQVAGARVDVAGYKKDPADFILWKPAKDDEPGWDAQFKCDGETVTINGRPGWHIECSAMAEKILGLPFDIHGGGADLKFPHHENEIAQSCCAHGHDSDLSQFSKTWIHNGFVTVDGEKMSKSLGNFLLAHDLLKDHKGEALRLTLLSAHYRQPLDWSEDKIVQNTKFLDKVYKRLREMDDMPADDSAHIPEGVMGALSDDLNTPKAIAEMNGLLKNDNSPALKAQLHKIGKIMGVFQILPEDWFACVDDVSGVDVCAIEALIAERNTAKADKNWARADEIRDELAAQGITMADTPDGTTWSKA